MITFGLVFFVGWVLGGLCYRWLVSKPTERRIAAAEAGIRDLLAAMPSDFFTLADVRFLDPETGLFFTPSAAEEAPCWNGAHMALNMHRRRDGKFLVVPVSRTRPAGP
jgi:hypothetical protein